MEVHRSTATQIMEKLIQNGFDKIEKYGLMVACNLLKDNEPKYNQDYFQKLKEIELRLLQEYPYTEIARFNQFIAVKNKDYT